nr:endospore germination permease [Bacillus sp. FJAT-47783]
MFENEKISSSQFMYLVISFTIGSSVLLAPGLLVAEAKQDGWLAGIIGLGIGLICVILYIALGKQFPNKTIAEMNEIVFGKWIGKFVSISFYIFLSVLGGTVLWDIGNFMVTQIFVETPIEAFHFVVISIVIMGTRLGIETIVRTAEIFIPWIFILLFVLLILIVPQIDFTKIQPVLENGSKPVVHSAIIFSATPFVQLVVFLMIFPYVNRLKQASKAYLLGTVIAGLFLIIITTISITVLGAQITSLQAYPSYILSKKISVWKFFERMEAIIAIVWMLTIYFKLTTIFYALSLGIAQTLNMKDYRVVTIPLGTSITILGIITSPNSVYLNEFASTEWIAYSFTYGVFMPLVLFITAKIRKLSP